MKNQHKPVQVKLGLLKLADEMGSVSKACQMMNISRDSYYRFRSLYDKAGVEGLKEVNRRKPLLKNRVSAGVESAVRQCAYNSPEHGQQKTSDILKARNISVSASGVRSIWVRNDLETFTKRIQAIRAKILQGEVQATRQHIDLMKRAEKLSPPDNIELGGPGFLCFQGLRPLGHLQGIGQVYQHVFLDYYSRYAFVRATTAKAPSSAIDFLESDVLPWFQSKHVLVKTVISDRGQTFCGRGTRNDYQKLLETRGIRHQFRSSRATRKAEPWTQFTNTMKAEFYRFSLRERAAWNMDELQNAIDRWIDFYNHERPNTSQFCYGKTPLKTFLASFSMRS